MINPFDLKISCILYTNLILTNIVIVSTQAENLEATPIHENEENLDEIDSPEATQQHPPPLPVRIPYSSAPLYLKRLAQTEQYIYQSLLKYEQQLQERLEILQRLREDYESSVLVAMQHFQGPDGQVQLDEWSKAAAVSSHPIQVYRMIRRFAKDLQAFNEHIWQSLENELWETLESYRDKFAWPMQDDLITATKSLITLQDTHDFDINFFTDGAMRDHYVPVVLTARQCLEISTTALEMGEINAAAEWFQAAHFKGVNGLDSSVSMDELTQAWETTYQAFQTIWPMQIFTTHDVFKEAKELLRNDFIRSAGNLTAEYASVNFKSLCRGDQLLTENQLLEMTCYLENTNHPYHFLNPLKIEVYSWQPFVYKVHDFIRAKTIVNLSDVVVPSMVALVETGQAALQTRSFERTYTYNLLPDDSSETFSVLTNKISRLPGLNSLQLKTVPGDHYQITAFAVGNHYEPCIECFEAASLPQTAKIDRVISSVHVVSSVHYAYSFGNNDTLHEPEKGGELAFPLLGVSITPNVGSIIVHNEINVFGNADDRIMHGACPVLIGEKWIATKMIYGVVKDPVTVKSNKGTVEWKG